MLGLQEYIDALIDQTRFSCMELKNGGPFGALIFKKELEGITPIAVGFNRVIKDNDPTAHAEMVAIREACKNLHTYDLSNYCIYATGYPCPMCMSAILWSNIKTIYFSGTYEQAANIGFRDEFIFKFLKNNCKNDNVQLIHIPKQKLGDLYEEFKSLDIIY